MAKQSLTFDTVREIGTSLPDVLPGTAYGAPALKLRGRVLACVPVNRSAEPNSVVICIDPAQRARWLDADPDAYYVTDHYAPYPSVLVRLSRISRDRLARTLKLAWDYASSAHPAALSPRAARARTGAPAPRPKTSRPRRR
jgi:hypothetical protein